MSRPIPVSLHEYESAAREVCTGAAWDYLQGGGGDEITLHWNRERLNTLPLLPRVLRDVSHVNTHVSLLGLDLPSPILLGPTGCHKLFHPEGECATARGAGDVGTVYTASTASTTKLEAIAEASNAPLWFQLHMQRDRAFTVDLMQRAESSGYHALVLTVDTPMFGVHDRDTRRQLQLPPDLTLANLEQCPTAEPGANLFHYTANNPYLDPSLDWDVLAWLRSRTRLPIILKGILRADDAETAVRRGAAAIVVSNHGGRVLDTVPATIDVLPEVVEAVDDRVPVLFDSGIRRGVDVVKALALGASAVLLGRPYVWGLAVDGADGVRRVTRMLQTEFELAMAQCGARNLGELDAQLVRRTWPLPVTTNRSLPNTRSIPRSI